MPWLFVFGWFFFALGERSEENRKKAIARAEIYSASGVHDLLEEGNEDEAMEVYQKFTGVDEYAARDIIAKIKREMHRDV